MNKLRFEFAFRCVRKLHKAFPNLSAVTLVDMTSAWIKGSTSDAAVAVVSAFSASNDEALLFPLLTLLSPRFVVGPAKGMLP